MATATSPVTFRTAKRFDLIVTSRKSNKIIEEMIDATDFDRIFDIVDYVKQCNDDYDAILNTREFTAEDLAHEMNYAFDDYFHIVRFYAERFPTEEIAAECEHDLVVESTSDFYGNDTGNMNCCKKCDHQEPIVASDWVE